MFKNTLLGTDGLAAAERAAKVAASLAMRYDAQITVIHTFSPIPRRLGGPSFDKAARKALSESRQLVESMVNRVHELDAHGLNWLQSILLGSVSMTEAQHVRCLVLVVK